MLTSLHKAQLLSQALFKLPKHLHVLCPPYSPQDKLIADPAVNADVPTQLECNHPHDSNNLNSTKAQPLSISTIFPNYTKVHKLLENLQSSQDQVYAQHLTQYMQAMAGGYGAGDRFLGIKIPHLRKILKPYLKQTWSLEELSQLIHQPWHEARFSALILLNHSMQLLTKTESSLPTHSVLHQQAKQQMLHNVSFYLSNAAQCVNNWDLVDVSAPEILGKFILPWPEYERSALLTAIALSDNLWERRIAVVATWPLIKAGSFQELSCQIPLLLNELHPKYDLLDKALGWMLREIGKQDEQALITKLEEYLGIWPSITLSYATERLSPSVRHDLQQRNRQIKKQNESHGQ